MIASPRTLRISLIVLSLMGSTMITSAEEAAQQPAAQPATQTTASAPEGQGTHQANQNRRNGERSDQRGQATASATEEHRLPPDSVTKQTLTLPGRTLAYTATAGSVRIYNDKNEPEADIVVTSYQLDGADPHTRPVTFVFNGGPGSASAWLQFGNLGPWRIKMTGEALSPSAPPTLMPNAETWLDFTDLVFIDPVGTGYSRFVKENEEVRKKLFSVNGDASSIALVIRRWLEKSNRLLSPKYVVGESYGGIRGPKVVHDLQTREGVGVRGLILISPVLDFRDFGGSFMRHVADLPTFAAVAREAKGPVTRADMADVERYAAGDFLLDLVRGEADTAATNRISDKIAQLTGIDQAIVRRLAGRMDAIEFRREFDRRNGLVTGRYDASVTGVDPFPDSSFYRFGDPASDPLVAPLTSAAVDYYNTRLKWRPEGSYVLGSGTAFKNWDWGRGLDPTQSITQIREILALDPAMKLLVAQGLFDLATPYFGTKIQLDQLPAYASPTRVKFVVYPGGHMFYSRDASRQALRGEAEGMMK